MFLTAAGLRSHIWNNNLRSVLLLAGFPVLLVLMGLALTWLTFGLADPYAAGYGTKAAMPDLVAAELARLPSIAAWVPGPGRGLVRHRLVFPPVDDQCGDRRPPGLAA